MDTENWKDFYVATAGAAAALAGLVFVALSINLNRILGLPGMVARAAETLVLLAAALITALVALIPGQSSGMMGAQLGIVALISWGLPSASHVGAGRARHYQYRWHLFARVVLHQVATIPLLVASGMLLAAADRALYWLALGIVLVLIVGLFNAWVLLVEIVR
jgi:modulator of FtsH protease